MKTILVPTDFSDIARNAASYAMRLAADVDAQKIVFYNAYQAPPVLTDNTIPAMPVMDIETMRDISEQSMKAFQEKMQQECPAGVALEHRTGFSILSDDINDICEDVGADLIVMGITGTSKIEEVLIGSTAISVMKLTKVPVIIVPAEATYNSIKNVMLACDFKNVIETTPVQPIKNILHATKAALHVVNVYESEKEITADKTYQQELLQSLLKAYDPQFHFENNDNFIDGINHFVETNNIDMIITIPRKHKFLEGLFKERHTKKLAFHSHVPLMYIHQEDL
jgi:nucleotide-binding universal stress UspA family protein